VAEATDPLYCLIVRFELLDGHEDAFDALVSETLERISTDEPRTLVYVTHVDPSAASVRVFYEVYADRAAFEAHEATAHVGRFLAGRHQHLRTDPIVWRVSPTAGVMRQGIDLAGA
jgi:quinol monooxygenase YgiN